MDKTAELISTSHVMVGSLDQDGGGRGDADIKREACTFRNTWRYRYVGFKGSKVFWARAEKGSPPSFHDREKVKQSAFLTSTPAPAGAIGSHSLVVKMRDRWKAFTFLGRSQHTPQLSNIYRPANEREKKSRLKARFKS